MVNVVKLEAVLSQREKKTPGLDVYQAWHL